MLPKHLDMSEESVQFMNTFSVVENLVSHGCELFPYAGTLEDQIAWIQKSYHLVMPHRSLLSGRTAQRLGRQRVQSAVGPLYWPYPAQIEVPPENVRLRSRWHDQQQRRSTGCIQAFNKLGASLVSQPQFARAFTGQRRVAL